MIEPLAVCSASTRDPEVSEERDCAALAARSALLFAMALSLALFQLIDDGDEVVLIGTTLDTVGGVLTEEDRRSIDSGTRFEGVVGDERPATEVPGSALTLTALRSERALDAAPSPGVEAVATSLLRMPKLERKFLIGRTEGPGSLV